MNGTYRLLFQRKAYFFTKLFGEALRYGALGSPHPNCGHNIKGINNAYAAEAANAANVANAVLEPPDSGHKGQRFRQQPDGISPGKDARGDDGPPHVLGPSPIGDCGQKGRLMGVVPGFGQALRTKPTFVGSKIRNTIHLKYFIYETVIRLQFPQILKLENMVPNLSPQKIPGSDKSGVLAMPTNKKNLSTLQKSPLFQGISDPELVKMAKCLGARVKTYAKGDNVYLIGDFVREIGVVVRGHVHIVKDDAWGNQNIIAKIGEGEMFAEAFICSGVGVLPVSVISSADCEIMFVDLQRIITQCANSCVFHSLLIRNIIGILARNNMLLLGKMEHITKRTTREKLLSYLSEQARQNGSNSFEVPFDRQGLANYLSVERSALSAEMSRLKSEGIIDYRKSHFEILSEHRLLKGSELLETSH
jgi:CRP-like cAMP-binding protein